MTDDRMDATIGNLLRTGVSVAAAVVLAGGVWYLASTSAPPAYAHFTPRVAGIRSFGTLTGPEQTILAGLLILIATPVARVIFSLIAFAIERDRVYVVITLIVLLVLLYSIGTSWL